MLDFGFSEIVLTSAIALVVLGPERLPKVARQVGNWMGRARAMARQLSEQLEREVNAEELLKAQAKTRPPVAPATPVAPNPQFPTPLAPSAVQEPFPDSVANAIADAHRMAAEERIAAAEGSSAAERSLADAASSAAHAGPAVDYPSAAALRAGSDTAVPLHESTPASPEASKPGYE